MLLHLDDIQAKLLKDWLQGTKLLPQEMRELVVLLNQLDVLEGTE